MLHFTGVAYTRVIGLAMLRGWSASQPRHMQIGDGEGKGGWIIPPLVK